MSSSSGFGASSASNDNVFGSSAMPQIGQLPGSDRTIWGCIGQTHSVRSVGSGSFGSNAIPHFGHASGRSETTSGSIGQT